MRWVQGAWVGCLSALSTVLIAGAAQASSAPLWTQVSGAEVDGAPNLRDLAAATLGDRVVLLGSLQQGETWTWRDGVWSKAIVPPLPWYGPYLLATVGERVLAYGDCSPCFSQRNDDNDEDFVAHTWSFDGVTWTESTTPSPSWRLESAMAAWGDKVVLFGGLRGTVRQDTWVWDGATWTRHLPATSPPPRWGHAMVPFDGKALLFGGVGATGQTLRDTWVWDGATWTEVTPPAGPPARWGHAMATLGERILLTGGTTYPSTSENPGQVGLSDAWAWDGQRWTEVATPPAGLPARWHHVMASVGSRVIMFGGRGGGILRSLAGIPKGPGTVNLRDTWSWDGQVWTRLDPIRPSPRMGAALAALDDRLVLFGGAGDPSGVGQRGYFGDTWTWNGSTWTDLGAASGPSARYALAMARRAGEVVSFGGWGADGVTGDTWSFTGAGWTRKEPAAGPPARSNHAMATLGDTVVLFGGFDGTSLLGDTWTWNGDTWTRLDLPIAPPARSNHAMATWRDRVVLFGGWSCAATGCGRVGDTWEFDGRGWREVSPLLSSECEGPLPRSDHAMATLGDAVITFGGTSGDDYGYVYAADTWQWDGSSWSPADAPPTLPPSGPLPRVLHAMGTWDQQVVVFGGNASIEYSGVVQSYVLDDTWAAVAGGTGSATARVCAGRARPGGGGCSCTVVEPTDVAFGAPGGFSGALSVAAWLLCRRRRTARGVAGGGDERGEG
jgi:hypothetical protein